MLRRITYTVGWLTMVVPTQVRGCANVGALTALGVPTQSERRSAKIEASPQMDPLVRPEHQIDRTGARLTASQHQPTDGLDTGGARATSNCDRVATIAGPSTAVRPRTVSNGKSHEAVRVTAARSSDVALASPARRGDQSKFKPGECNPRNKHYHCGYCGFSWSNALKVCKHWVEKHGMSAEEAASLMAAQNPGIALDAPVRRGAQFKFKPGERNPKNSWYHCGHCGFRWPNARKVCNHWVEKHGMSTDEAVSVMTAQNPDLILDKPPRRGRERKRKPGEYNSKFKRYHCGHCSRQSSSEEVIRDHWVEKHGMSTEEAASVMAAQNPSPSTSSTSW
jgi:uncharacterized DUF497 family protein